MIASALERYGFINTAWSFHVDRPVPMWYLDETDLRSASSVLSESIYRPSQCRSSFPSSLLNYCFCDTETIQALTAALA